jgi:hypothetical protein
MMATAARMDMPAVPPPIEWEVILTPTHPKPPDFITDLTPRAARIETGAVAQPGGMHSRKTAPHVALHPVRKRSGWPPEEKREIRHRRLHSPCLIMHGDTKSCNIFQNISCPEMVALRAFSILLHNKNNL